MLTRAPHPDETSGHADAGFTLVETLVGLAILAIALSVLLTVFGDSIRRERRAEQSAAAGLHAQSLLARAGADIPLSVGATTGTLPNGMYWLLHVERYGNAADRKAWPAGVYRVVIEIMPEHGEPQKPLATLATLRLGPKERQR